MAAIRLDSDIAVVANRVGVLYYTRAPSGKPI